MTANPASDVLAAGVCCNRTYVATSSRRKRPADARRFTAVRGFSAPDYLRQGVSHRQAPETIGFMTTWATDPHHGHDRQWIDAPLHRACSRSSPLRRTGPAGICFNGSPETDEVDYGGAWAGSVNAGRAVNQKTADVVTGDVLRPEVDTRTVAAVVAR
jgi:hypothetical protein